MSNKVAAVIVVYYPKINDINVLCKSLLCQVHSIVIIDNTPKDAQLNFTMDLSNVEVVNLGVNKGIGYAQNVGIKICIEANYDYILLSDQDTKYPENYVTTLLATFHRNHVNTAAVTPLFIDDHQHIKQHGYFMQESFWGVKNIAVKEGEYNIFQAIVSGMMINSKHLADIGLFNEALFIDWIDYEWCWRVNRVGFQIIGNANIKIKHKIGDQVKSIGIKKIYLHSNQDRQYYITRNAFYLAIRTNYLTLSQKLAMFIKSFSYIIIYPMLLKPHLSILKLLLRGFYHGLIGNLGKLSVPKDN